jgi:EpsD family peptidyl-prolyl cis-trans isomerase
MKQQHKLIVLVAAVTLSLSACSGKESETTANLSPAVKVNGQVISDAELQLKGGMHTGEVDKKHPISEQAMQSMLSMELLRQAAVEAKLDADETVRARLAISMRSILAKAYLEKLLAEVAKPTAADISAYYNQHPERFSNRKQLTLKEVIIQPNTGKEAEIKAEVGKGKKITDFETWLLANKIAFNSAPGSATTDQIPEETLPKLKAVPVGGSAIVEGHDGMHVIFVLDAQPHQPLALEQASPMISNMLFEKGRKEALDNKIKSLHDKAKLEYVAPYTAKGLADAG